MIMRIVKPHDGELTSLRETAHLLRSPRNAKRLLAALQRAIRGKGKRGSVDKLRKLVGNDDPERSIEEFRRI